MSYTEFKKQIDGKIGKLVDTKVKALLNQEAVDNYVTEATDDDLQKIADITGGKYYMANSEQALQEVFQEIEGLERSELEVSSRIIYEELYHYYLLLGGIMFLLAEMYRRHVLKEGL
jgi:hypothetical protein